MSELSRKKEEEIQKTSSIRKQKEHRKSENKQSNVDVLLFILAIFFFSTFTLDN